MAQDAASQPTSDESASAASSDEPKSSEALDANAPRRHGKWKIFLSALAGIIVGLGFAYLTALGLIEYRAKNMGPKINGWTVNYRRDKADEDILLRAAIAKHLLGAVDRKEAIYYITHDDSQGRRLSGDHRYRMHIAADNFPDVKAFWSLTLYGEDDYMVDNPIKRYSIGDRTQGVQYNDGSLDILIQYKEPGAGQSNWLPAPEGNFSVVFRCFQPKPKGNVLERKWQIPKLERLD